MRYEPAPMMIYTGAFGVEIHHYRPENLPVEVHWQVLAFLRVIDTAGFMGRWRGRRWISRPEFNPVHVVLMDGDFVVAHAEALSMRWQHRGIDYEAWGISGVFVYPDYQKQGHGIQIIQAATDYIARQPNADIGLLWCAPHLRGFYLRCGWQPMEAVTTVLGTSLEAAKAHDEEILFMRFFSSKGVQQQSDFQSGTLYFGWTTW